MLATIHAEHSPEQRCPTDGGASACPEAWEMRHMYIVKACLIARINALDLSTVSSDSEMWFEPYINTKIAQATSSIAITGWRCDRPVPDARVAIYPFKRSFVVGAVHRRAVRAGDDVLSAGAGNAGARSWYINMGAVDRNFFTTDAMFRAASF